MQQYHSLTLFSETAEIFGCILKQKGRDEGGEKKQGVEKSLREMPGMKRL